MEEPTVAKTLRYLIEQKETSVPEISVALGIPRTTLYSMVKKQTDQVDLKTLKAVADYFQVDLSIFCGLENYKEPVELDEHEREILTIFRTLNETGKHRLLEYTRELGGNPNMRA